MMKSDSPIIKKDEDLLDRFSSAEILGKNIAGYSDEDSIVIGIEGGWGEGKSSYMNLVLESIKGNKKILVVHFNPWDFSKRSSLISDFFSEISGELDKIYSPEYETTYASICTNLNTLSTFYIPPISSEKNSDEDVKINLKDVKNNIERSLKKLDKKLLIIIDDLDRLYDKEIREIFSLVKSIGNLKSTIYILLYDREVVVKALDKVQDGKGEAYLEKIVQVPEKLPFVSKEKIRKIFMEKINEILINYKQWNASIMYNEDFEFEDKVAYSLHTIRDMERFFNVMDFGLKVASEELYLLDYIGITLIKVFEPEFYKYIMDNKNLFAGDNFYSPYSLDETINKKQLIDYFEKYSSKKLDKNILTGLIIFLFPKTTFLKYNDISITSGIYSYKEKRIASSKYFDLYFRSSFPIGEVKTEEINEILNFQIIEDLEACFNVEESKQLSLLDRLLYDCEKIPREKMKDFLKFICSLASVDWNREESRLFRFLDKDCKISRIIYKLINNLDKSKKIEIMAQLFTEEKKSFHVLIIIFGWYFNVNEENEKGKYVEKEELLDKNELEKLLNILITNMKNNIDTSNKVVLNYFGTILSKLKKYGKEEEAKIILDKYLKHDEILFDIISSFSSNDGYKKNFYKTNIEEFFVYDDLIKKIESFPENIKSENKKIIDAIKNAVTEEQEKKNGGV